MPSPYPGLVATRLLGWILLVALLLAGLAGLTGAVEAATLGAGGAGRAALSAAVAALVLLAPTLAATGTATAAARMAALGEALAAALAGIAPHRGAAVALAVGLLVGGAQHAAADHLLWRAALPPVTATRTPPPAWVWLTDHAVRPADGTVVRLDPEGRLDEILRGVPVDAEALATARALQRPQTASGARLRAAEGEGVAVAATLERHSRVARGLSCGVLAAGAWLLGGEGARRIGTTLALALAWQALDALLYAAAAQGQLAPHTGAWGAAMLALAAVAALAALRGSR